MAVRYRLSRILRRAQIVKRGWTRYVDVVSDEVSMNPPRRLSTNAPYRLGVPSGGVIAPRGLVTEEAA